MSVRPIVLFPDPVLRTRGAAVNASALATAELIRDLIDTAKKLGAWGLSAHQLGQAVRLAVVAQIGGSPAHGHVGPNWQADPIILCNPTIEDWGGWEVKAEACFSLPGRAVKVGRPRRVTVSWENQLKAPQRAVFSGWQARAVQHEIDHLNGLLIIDQSSKINRMTGEDRRAA